MLAVVEKTDSKHFSLKLHTSLLMDCILISCLWNWLEM